MGHAIAQVALLAGFEKVILNDIKIESLNNAAIKIEIGLKKLESKGKLDEGVSVDALMSRLVKEVDLAKAVAEADFVIEAVPEVMKIKQEVSKKIGEYAPKNVILATNTSTMSITKLGEASGRPEKVIGMHFFIPLLMKLIEITKGEKTSDETMNIAAAIGQKLPCIKGKRFIVRIEKETPGFIVNRVNLPVHIYFNWLFDQAAEKSIPLEQIDADARPIMSVGPCEVCDYIGLDICYDIMKYFEETISSDFKPGKVLTELYNEKNLGRKTGKGLLKWSGEKAIVNLDKKAGMFKPELALAIQLNEGCRLLEEDIVSGYKTIDDAILGGLGIPGPFVPGKRNYQRWAKILEELAEKSGKDYLKPCELMKSGGFLKFR